MNLRGQLTQLTSQIKEARKKVIQAHQQVLHCKREEFKADIHFLMVIEPDKTNIPDGSKSWNPEKRKIWKYENNASVYELVAESELVYEQAKMELQMLLDERKYFELLSAMEE
jgi:hypothetical protein